MAIRKKDGFYGERSLVLPRMVIEMMQNDEIMSTLHITDIGYYPRAFGHFRERVEPIDQFVLIYCISGKGTYTLGTRTYAVSAGNYFVLPSGLPHSYAADNDDPWTIYWVHFRGPHAGVLTAGLSTPQLLQPGKTSRISTRNSLFDEILETLDRGYDIENLQYAMSVFRHYLATLRYLRQYRASNEKSGDGNVIDATIRFMRENIENRITLASIAEFAGYAPSHLSAIFKKATGHSPLNYMNLLKVRRACELLDETQLKLSQICFRIGIHDPYYFSRFFSKMMGMSPSDYRSRQKE